jgi:hypothetical protein
MVPIHESDVAEERWLKAEWENYELWEKVEVRIKRQKSLWVIGTFLLFICLSAVPTAIERWPKWKTRSYARILAQEINQIKRDAGIEHSPYRIRVLEGEMSKLIVEKVSNCSESKGAYVRSIVFGNHYPEKFVREAAEPPEKSSKNQLVFLSPTEGTLLGIPGLVQSFCYDHLSGSSAPLQGQELVGFGIIPEADLAIKRTDRVTVLLLSGASGEMMFD